MTADDLSRYLEVMRAAGVKRGKLEVKASPDETMTLEVEFEPFPSPMGMVDKDGKPVNLDDGMGLLEGVEERDGDPIHTKNFPKATD